MTIKEMVYQFKLEANRVDSNQAQKFALPAIIAFLNGGQMQLMKTRYGSNNNYQATLEQIQKRIDEWQRLITPHVVLDGTPDESNRLYKFSLTQNKDYCFLLRASFLMSKGACVEQPSALAYITQSDDLNIVLDNPNASSNFDWREINYRLAQDHILAYTDPTFSFSIDKANIDYLRYPKAMDVSGYKHFNGTASADVECELPVFLHPEIVTEAVLLMKVPLNHPDLQAQMGKRQMQE